MGECSDDAATIERFPTTRYQGSKRKLLPWLRERLAHLDYDSALDLFSGSGAVAYLFKVLGKRVIANDVLRCNQQVAEALVVNESTRLGAETLDALLAPGEAEQDFIQRTFKGIFYPEAENAWLDRTVGRVDALEDGAERALARFALFQACLAKRPYNLFHRANLSMRTRQVKRTFGNKATWERPFEAHMRAFAAEGNGAVFASGRLHEARRGDYLSAPTGVDLVYADPPYMNARGGGVDYLDFYHFLEGLTEYARWPARLTTRYKHHPYERQPSPWLDRARIGGAFDALLERYRESIIVISYRADGTPDEAALEALLRRHGRRSTTASRSYRYALSRGRRRELLLISEP